MVKPPLSIPFLYNQNEVAAALGLSRSWLWSRRMKGGGPEWLCLDGVVRYTEQAILDYLGDSIVQDPLELGD